MGRTKLTENELNALDRKARFIREIMATMGQAREEFLNRQRTRRKEIDGFLVEARQIIGGSRQWGDWLKQSALTPRSALNYMRARK